VSGSRKHRRDRESKGPPPSADSRDRRPEEARPGGSPEGPDETRERPEGAERPVAGGSSGAERESKTRSEGPAEARHRDQEEVDRLLREMGVEPEVAPPEGPESASEASGAPVEGPLPVEEIPRVAKRITKKELLQRLAERNQQIFDLDKKLRALEGGRSELVDRLARARAEFENYRKRSRKEWELHRATATQDLILELLPVLDNFERAQSLGVGAGPEELIEGYTLVYQGLLEVLAKHGVRPIEAQGVPFDPRLHEAFQEVEDSSLPSHHVAEVLQKGYYLGDKVLRPARVSVTR
jgi:molecular chaperone GrpE